MVERGTDVEVNEHILGCVLSAAKSFADMISYYANLRNDSNVHGSRDRDGDGRNGNEVVAPSDCLHG
jgi:hypothetical protein